MAPVVRPKRGFGPGAVVGVIWDIRDDIEAGSGAVGVTGRAVCDAVASTGFNQIPLNNRTGVGYVCEPYWDAEGIDPPVEQFPFMGGQCPTPYNYTVTLTGDRGNGTETIASGSGSRPGPFNPVVWEAGTGSAGDANVRLLDGNGNTAYSLTNAGSGFSGKQLSATFSRVDGGPDDCGDPPSTSVPGPNNPGTPYGDPISVPGFPDTTIRVRPPRFGPDGAPSWDVDIEIGGDPVGGPVEFTPTGQPSPPAPPEVTEEPPQAVGPSGDVDAEPETEEGRLIGYRWSFPSVPSNRGEIAGTNPRIFYPVIGSIQLKLETPSGTAYGPQRQIKESEGSIFSESADVLVRGVQWTHSTLYGNMQIVAVRVKDAG